MDAFFVEVERLRDPALRNRPVAVGGSGNRGVVASASYEARRFGVRSAMPMVAARRRCPQLVVVPPDHRSYEEWSGLVFDLLRSVTPTVEGLSVDEAFLDVSGLERHGLEPVAIGHLLRRRIRDELHLPASVGVAANKFVAKLASEAAKPDGLRHVPRDETTAFVQALGVRALWGVGEATHATLEGMGVVTVGDLARLPVATLTRRLGESHGRHLAALARGEDPRPVLPDQDIKSLTVSETYERDLQSVEEIETELLRLCDRLAGRMRRAGLAGHTAILTVRYASFETVSRHHTFLHPLTSSRDLRAAVRVLQGRVGWERPVRLLGVGLGALESGGQPRQLQVAGEPKWDDLAAAVDAVRDRFGQAAVLPARLIDTVPPPPEEHPGAGSK